MGRVGRQKKKKKHTSKHTGRRGKAKRDERHQPVVTTRVPFLPFRTLSSKPKRAAKPHLSCTDVNEVKRA
jgi:hypothetical protein